MTGKKTAVETATRWAVTGFLLLAPILVAIGSATEALAGEKSGPSAAKAGAVDDNPFADVIKNVDDEEARKLAALNGGAAEVAEAKQRAAEAKKLLAVAKQMKEDLDAAVKD